MTGDVWSSGQAFSDWMDGHMVVWGVQNVPDDNGSVFFTLLCALAWNVLFSP